MGAGVKQWILGAVLLLAGCGARDGGTLGFCEAQADGTPAVKELTLKSVSNPYFMSQSSDLIAATKAEAVRDCLKRQGIVSAGAGVEGTPRTDTLLQK